MTALADRIEASRRAETPLAIAIVDLDGFRLVNDNYGHAAGDIALRRVAGILRREFGPATTIGRYGPDEFLVIVEPADVVGLEPALERLRAALASDALDFDQSESPADHRERGDVRVPDRCGVGDRSPRRCRPDPDRGEGVGRRCRPGRRAPADRDRGEPDASTSSRG